MAPNNATLNFVVKMQNQAQAALNSLSQGFKSVGGQASGAGKGVNSLALQLTGLNQSAQLASQGLRGISSTVGANLEAFSRYDLAMNRVQRVTGESSESMVSFKRSFNTMAQDLRTVDVSRLQQVAVQAAQLGIVGEKDILTFTSTIGKLETSLSDLGEDAPKLIARVLAATGQGVDGVENFASVLVKMAKDASASEQVILNMTSQLGQSTAQFNVSAAALLGLSTAASNLNFKPELFGTAMQRTFQQLKEGAQQSSEGMRDLTSITGLSAKEFENLINTKPDEAFILFLDVLKQLNAEGLSTASFLQKFNLQASENVRVLGAAAQNVDEFAKYLRQANEETLNPVSLDQEFVTALEAYATSTTEATNAWELFKVSVGEALAPIATGVLNVITKALNGLSDTINNMPQWMATAAAAVGVLLASLVSLGPAIVGVIGVLKLFGGLGAWKVLSMAGGWVVALAGGFLRLGATVASIARLGPVMTFLAAGIGAVVTAIGIVPVLITAAIAAAVALGVAIYQNWDAVVEFLSQPIGDILAQTFNASVDAAVTGFWNILDGIKGAWDSFWGSPEMRVPEQNMTPDARAKAQEANRAAFIERNSGAINDTGGVVSAVSEEYQKTIAELDTQTEQLDKIIEQEFALRRLREVGANDPYRVTMGITDEDIARMERLVSFARIEANAVSAKMQALQEEAPMAAARTAAQKNSAEIETAILEIIKKQGDIRAEDEQMLRDQIGYLQQIRAETALSTEMRQATNSLELSRAITREQQNQVELAQKRVQLEEEYGGELSQVAAILQAMSETLQSDQFNALESRLDPLGAATRAFADDQGTLNAQLSSGAITLERYNFLMAALARTTEDARNPYAALIRNMREEIDLLGITGPYRQADQAALKQVNQLKQQGVMVTADMAAAMQELYRATEDYRQSVEEGFAGWAANIKDTKGQILELQEAFAEGASSLLSDALAGEEDALLNFIDGMKKKLLDAFSDAVMKQIFGALGNNMNGLLDSTFGNPKSGAEQALAQLSNMSAMNVTAAAVYINGTPMGVGAAPGFSESFGTPANQNSAPWSPAANNNTAAVSPPPPQWSPPSSSRGSSPIVVDSRMDNIGTFPQAGANMPWSTPPVQPYTQGFGPSWLGGNSGGGAAGGLSSSVPALTEFNSALQTVTGSTNTYHQQMDEMIAKSMELVNATPETELLNQSTKGQNVVDQSMAALNAQQAAEGYTAVNYAVEQAAQRAREAAEGFSQAGDKIQQAGQKANSSSPSLGSFGSNINTVGDNAVGAGKGLGGLGGILGQLMGGLGGGMGGGGGGGFGSIFSSIFGMLFHDGGKVGTTSKGRNVNPMMFMNAPRFHEGLGNDEYPAILQRGERVLTAQQNTRTENVMSGLMAANSNGQGNNITIGDINVTTQSTGDSGMDEKNAKETAKAIDAMLEKKIAKWASNQSRPGGIMAKGGR